ncbi:MAG: HAD-IA family hydrolase [Lachnospiraceae bacterium]|nr:HAD-IA family hydrolase [Lachnospiraceae bacterium]
MRKVILFDLDDTLAPEDDFIRSGYSKVAEFLKEKYGAKDDASIRLYSLYKEDPKLVFNRFLEDEGIPYTDEDIKELIRVYREHEPKVDYYPDVLPNLYKLRDMGARLGIISDGYAVSQRNKLNVLKTKGIFDKIIITDELGREYWKPDIRSFIMMKEAFGAKWEDMVYVGDNPGKDFYIGRDRMIATIRIYREGSVYENAPYYENIKESIGIGSFDELPDAIKRV